VSDGSLGVLQSPSPGFCGCQGFCGGKDLQQGFCTRQAGRVEGLDSLSCDLLRSPPDALGLPLIMCLVGVSSTAQEKLPVMPPSPLALYTPPMPVWAGTCAGSPDRPLCVVRRKSKDDVKETPPSLPRLSCLTWAAGCLPCRRCGVVLVCVAAADACTLPVEGRVCAAVDGVEPFQCPQRCCFMAAGPERL
jgi:hypothetical protein